ncbi:DUF4998 domain-containing protein [Wocania ichthyoenteri]|uniref:DUF4998 domain-containing protein n=1 Tax=Wocania ichthyoenteri TaxID=1230531 RepID=UPI00053D25EA|nr:DUF4998 domain-containing protein [Wocania ichthyoenteri]
MKLFKYYIASIVLLMVFVFSSCNDTYEFHQKYIEDGEVQYSNKVDSLKTYSGNNRLKIEGYISNAFNVNEIIVYWNNRENNEIFPYTKSQNQTDALEFIIDNLEEKSYTFEVVSKETSGNVSIKTVVFGTVYGENFRSSLNPRATNTFSYKSDAKADVTFKLSDDLVRNTELKYTNLSNVEVVDIIANDTNSISIEQLDITKPIQYRTFYVPTLADENGMETSIDQFSSDWNTINHPLKLETILNSVTFQPVSGGVKVDWQNSENLDVIFNFKNTVAGNPVNKSITSNSTVGTYTITPMENGTQNIEITTTDVYGNSWAKIYSVTPI